jgi:hypothetical protein
VRLADLLHRAGFSVFDGIGCSYLPVSFGIKADGAPVYPTLTDTDGKLCGKEGQKYNVVGFKVPEKLPPKSIVMAVNGGVIISMFPIGTAKPYIRLLLSCKRSAQWVRFSSTAATVTCPAQCP